jgi:hypothetical protein
MHVAAAIGIQPHIVPIVRHPPALVVKGLRDLRLDAAAVVIIAERRIPALRDALVNPLERRVPLAIPDAGDPVLVEIIPGGGDELGVLELRHGCSDLPLMEGPVAAPVADDHELQRIAARGEGDGRRLRSQSERSRAVDEKLPPGWLTDRQVHLHS